MPGDLVVLNAGEKAPGDGELLEATRLSVDEAILTGESEPVNKRPLRQAVGEMPGAGSGGYQRPAIAGIHGHHRGYRAGDFATSPDGNRYGTWR